MDPAVVTIVTALATGAAAAANVVASTAIMEAYAGLKRVVIDRYNRAGPFFELVAADPSSQTEQQVLATQLEQAGAGADQELRAAAQALLDAIEGLRNEPRAQALFDFDQLRVARDMQLEDIEAAQVIRVRGTAEIEGSFTAKGIRQGQARGTPSKN